ncbi:MAG: methyltransferase domain-containing protein [Elusimicrobia bacterium]|nr:methyltransferase domain-containing protein [Elusimicrobiota bacterium]
MATLGAYQRSAALKAAVDLDVFTGIEEGKATSSALAARSNAAERGMRILCDYLVVIGLLTKSKNRYFLTPDSAAFLSRKSPACMASMADFLCSPHIAEGFKDLTASVRRGGASPSAPSLQPEHPMWVEFARSMVPLMAKPAEMIADVLKADAAPAWKVLDVAAGHGIFGVTLARRNPRARIVALDWPNVLAVAQENASAAGVAQRFSTISGSAFDADFGKDYDVVLLTNILHHFDAATIGTLLRKVHAALRPGGKAVALEFVPNEDRVTPPQAAGFSIVMLAGTPAGDAYTFAEYRKMFADAGFSGVKNHPLLPTPESAVVATR